MENKIVFGLIGKNISYSFSKKYFSEKFTKLKLNNHLYTNFDIQSIDDFPILFSENIEFLKGMNVTIPYKEEIFKYLDEIDDVAQKIGAVNTIKILDNYRLKGFNTDAYGFEKSLIPILQNQVQNALILGTGGASKAIAYVLRKIDIPYKLVSRSPHNKDEISYKDINAELMAKHQLIVNCTPLGTFPNMDALPDLPYQNLTSKHILFDLIYNPEISSFLQKGLESGSVIKNGLEMLQFQAEKSWEIWNQ